MTPTANGNATLMLEIFSAIERRDPPAADRVVPSRRRILLVDVAALWRDGPRLSDPRPDLDPHVGSAAANRDGARPGAARYRIE